MLTQYVFLVLALAVVTAKQDETVDTEAGKVDTEAGKVDTEACLRDAKAAHPGNPNDELDAFLACVVSRLDKVSKVEKVGEAESRICGGGRLLESYNRRCLGGTGP